MATADSFTDSYTSRAEVPEKYTWDLTSLFADEQAFEAALAEAKELPAAYASWKERALSSGADLLAYLRFDDDATIQFQKVWNYAGRKADEDTRVSRWQDTVSQIVSLDSSIQAESAWFQPALLGLDDTVLAAWYESTPGLSLYKLALDRMRALKDHTLSPKEEGLLAQAGVLAAQPNQVFTMMNDADLKFPDALDSKGTPHPVTHGSYAAVCLMSKDRTLRENAYHSVYGAYAKVKNTAAAVLASQMRSLKFFADARHYGSSLEAALVPTEVPVAVYDSLIDSVHAHAGSMHRYMELRKKVLGVDRLHYWDIYTPIVSAPERHYTFEEACELMYKALAPLGEDYIETVKQGVSSRWIDVFETPGKMSGAYSADGHGMAPLILLNYQGTLDEVSTLCHEMGHSMQTWLSNHTQPARYAEYAMFVAEVASTTNECLLVHYLLDHESDPEQRTYLLNQYLEKFRGTLFRQTLFAEFERDANAACAEGVGMGADDLSRRYRALNDLYYGPAVETDDEIALEWARIPHFYYNFYVYVYATSFAAAVALSNRILTEGQPAVDDYLAFLSGGCSKSPIELLRGAGVDMASGAAVDAALEEFGRLVDELEKLL